jgi:hypothetical protein
MTGATLRNTVASPTGAVGMSTVGRHKHNMPVSTVHFRAMPAISLVRRTASSRCGQDHLIQKVTELGCRSESKAQVCNSNNMVRCGPRCHRFPNVHREQGAQNATPYPHRRNGIEVDDGCFQQVVYVRDLCRFRGLAHRQSSPLVAEANLTYFAIDVDSRRGIRARALSNTWWRCRAAPPPPRGPQGEVKVQTPRGNVAATSRRNGSSGSRLRRRTPQ